MGRASATGQPGQHPGGHAVTELLDQYRELCACGLCQAACRSLGLALHLQESAAAHKYADELAGYDNGILRDKVPDELSLDAFYALLSQSRLLREHGFQAAAKKAMRLADEWLERVRMQQLAPDRDVSAAPAADASAPDPQKPEPPRAPAADDSGEAAQPPQPPYQPAPPVTGSEPDDEPAPDASVPALCGNSKPRGGRRSRGDGGLLLKRHDHAAARIAAWWRDHQTRCYLARARRAATLVVACGRGLLARLTRADASATLAALAADQRRSRAATTLTAAWRTRTASWALADARRAACTIVACWRSRVASWALADAQWAATLIAALWHGRVARAQHMRSLRLQDSALASAIQAAWRGHTVRRGMIWLAAQDAREIAIDLAAAELTVSDSVPGCRPHRSCKWPGLTKGEMPSSRPDARAARLRNKVRKADLHKKTSTRSTRGIDLFIGLPPLNESL